MSKRGREFTLKEYGDAERNDMNGLQKGALNTSNGSDVAAIEIIKERKTRQDLHNCIISSYSQPRWL